MKIRLISLFNNKVESSIICPFCDMPTIYHSKEIHGIEGWECFHHCNMFFYQQNEVWYYKRIKKGELCKKTHLMPRYVLK